jgi:retinol dehydrogenase-14
MDVNRVCLVTGASGGIGLATAKELARRGFRVRIAGRSAEKLAAAEREIGGDVVSFRGDFSSLDEVRRVAEALLARGEPLHVLVNNAGVWHPDFRRSTDGFEDTFAVNHLASFLLTHLLLPRMRETEGDRRVVHVSSRLHVQAGQTASLRGRLVHFLNVAGVHVSRGGARFDFDAIDREEGFGGIEAYARSKLAQLLFSRELAEREREVTSNAVHPGSVATDVQRDNRLLHTLQPLARRFLKTPEQGARTSVHVACDESVRGVTGRYFANAREVPAAAIVDDAAIRARLWKLSAERVGLSG